MTTIVLLYYVLILICLNVCPLIHMSIGIYGHVDI